MIQRVLDYPNSYMPLITNTGRIRDLVHIIERAINIIVLPNRGQD